ncbi:MAG: fibronectin type III domain-containing protein, partial [Desulfuromonadales bacterium]|nr:fibronectin type III domain-containing protein [Desulfuromonadales bacterium]
GTAPPQCNATAPTLESATPGNAQASLNWTAEAGVEGYKVYYDQAGKSQLVADVGAATSFTDTGLTNSSEYCYKVSSYTAECESDFSNILCAIPNNPGQNNLEATLATGRYETTGKGKTKVITFVTTTIFSVGDGVILRATVLDEATGLPVPNATVNIDISGPQAASLSTGPSDSKGVAEATWQTQAPNRKGQGGTTPGNYTATTTDVTASGYIWDGVMTTTAFTLQ